MFHLIRATGHAEGWEYAFYIFTFVRGVLFFVVVILIGTGWSYLKVFLADREKKILMVVIPLQVRRQAVLGRAACVRGSRAGIFGAAGPATPLSPPQGGAPGASLQACAVESTSSLGSHQMCPAKRSPGPS
jgi:preprotein translocase subunit SecG